METVMDLLNSMFNNPNVGVATVITRATASAIGNGHIESGDKLSSSVIVEIKNSISECGNSTEESINEEDLLIASMSISQQEPSNFIEEALSFLEDLMEEYPDKN